MAKTVCKLSAKKIDVKSYKKTYQKIIIAKHISSHSNLTRVKQWEFVAYLDV